VARVRVEAKPGLRSAARHSVQPQLDRIGADIVDDIRAGIVASGRVATGHMIDTVSHHMSEDTLVVGVGAEYAAFQDEGTENEDGTVRIEPALFFEDAIFTPRDGHGR
jgi:hypothetical protein